MQKLFQNILQVDKLIEDVKQLQVNSTSSGTALNLDATVDGATRYAMTAEQKAFLDNLMAVNNPSNI